VLNASNGIFRIGMYEVWNTMSLIFFCDFQFEKSATEKESSFSSRLKVRFPLFLQIW
jgi:hypothetical protein